MGGLRRASRKRKRMRFLLGGGAKGWSGLLAPAPQPASHRGEARGPDRDADQIGRRERIDGAGIVAVQGAHADHLVLGRPRAAEETDAVGACPLQVLDYLAAAHEREVV